MLLGAAAAAGLCVFAEGADRTVLVDSAVAAVADGVAPVLAVAADGAGAAGAVVAVVAAAEGVTGSRAADDCARCETRPMMMSTSTAIVRTAAIASFLLFGGGAKSTDCALPEISIVASSVDGVDGVTLIVDRSTSCARLQRRTSVGACAPAKGTSARAKSFIVA